MQLVTSWWHSPINLLLEFWPLSGHESLLNCLRAPNLSIETRKPYQTLRCKFSTVYPVRSTSFSWKQRGSTLHTKYEFDVLILFFILTCSFVVSHQFIEIQKCVLFVKLNFDRSMLHVRFIYDYDISNVPACMPNCICRDSTGRTNSFWVSNSTALSSADSFGARTFAQSGTRGRAERPCKSPWGLDTSLRDKRARRSTSDTWS